jgi:hypothetical protein
VTGNTLAKTAKIAKFRNFNFSELFLGGLGDLCERFSGSG